MSEIEKRVAQQAGLSDDELPMAPDPNLKFWAAGVLLALGAVGLCAAMGACLAG